MDLASHSLHSGTIVALPARASVCCASPSHDPALLFVSIPQWVQTHTSNHRQVKQTFPIVYIPSYVAGFLTHKSPGCAPVVTKYQNGSSANILCNFDLRAHKGTPITVFFVLIEDFQLVDPILII